MPPKALVEHESMVVRERGSQLVSVAHPSGQAPAAFLSTAVWDGFVVFENAVHDLPQRIGCRR